MPIIAGQITGSALSGSLDYTFLSNIPSGIVSGAAQVAESLPAGTVSSSGQIDYNSITNKLSGVVSSSEQVTPLLPGGTVSSSGQVDITTTTNYSTFSSSLATVDADQTTRIDNLASLTSSYAINATIQGQLANVVSSSTQIKSLLPADTVSSSGQVDITATTNYSTFSSSLATVDVEQTNRIDNLSSLTSSYAINSTIQSQLAGVVSSSTQVQPLLPDGTVSSSIQTIANLPTGTVSSSEQVVVQNTTGIGALATTGSNIFDADQIITGSLFISQNLTVFGSSSISYVSQSTLNIGTNKITVNTDSPAVRFGGLDVIDSGSSPLRSGSLYFDSINDQWIFVHANTDGGITSSVLLVGPATFNNIGNETLLTQNSILKSSGLEHIVESQITDNGVTVSITNGLSVGTNLTASQADITTLRATSITSSVSGALTGTFPYASLTSIPSDIVSSSTQVQTFLPGGTVSASSQYPGWVTSSTQIDYNNITNKLSGVVSSSVQVQPLLPDGTVSSSGQVDITTTTGYSTFSSSIATKNDTQDVSINALNAATSSYAINATIQGQLAGVVSSSTQVKPLLPGGTVSASGQVDITATTNYSTFSSSLATVDAGQTIRIDNLASQTSSYAINSTIQSQLAGVVSSSTQVKPLLPGGTVSSSTQFKTLTDPFTGSFTGSFVGGFSGSFSIPDGQTLGIGSQIFYPHTTNGFSVNEDFDASDSSTQTAYHFTSGDVNRTSVVFSLARTTQFTNMFGVTGSNTDNRFVIGSEFAVTDFEFRSGLGIRPVQLQGGSLLMRISRTGGVLASSFTGSILANNNVVSSSAQVAAFLPASTVSSSTQVNLTGTTGYSTFSSSIATKNDLQDVSINALNAATSSYAINSTIQSQLAGVVSSSTQVKPLLPDGSVSSSAQYPGWVTASSQIDYNSITNKLSGVVSSSTQVKPLLPGGTVSSSGQVALSGITGTTFATADFTFPQNLTVAGTLTAEQFITEYVSASVIYESGSSKFGDTNDDVMSVTGSIRVLGGNISGSFIGLVSQSAQIDYNSIQNKLSGVVSSSAQVQPLLPGGTVSSSAQYPGWVTSSAQIVWSSVNYNGGIVSSSAQVKPLLPGGTVSSSGQVDYNSITNKLSGVYSSSTQAVDAIAGQTIAPATVNATDVNSTNVTVTNTGSFGLLLPPSDNTGVVGNAALTWANGEFTNLTVNTTLTVRSAIDLADNDIIRFGTGDDWELFHNGTGNFMDLNVGDLIIRDNTTQRVVISRTTGDITTSGSLTTSGSQFAGIVSGSGTQYRLVVPVGTNLYAT